MIEIPPGTTIGGTGIDTIRKSRTLIREVNEQIRATGTALGGEADAYLILCECERFDCLERVALPAEVYEETRSDRERFVVVPGHEDPGVERLVANDGYCIVRVRPSVRGELAPNPLPAV